MLVSMTDMLNEARKNKYAVGQFNMNNYQWVQAILLAAKEKNAPVIIGVSDQIVDYLGGFHLIVATVKNMISNMRLTTAVALHLDHAQTVDRCLTAIDAGFSSVMFDGSTLSIKENIDKTKEITRYAKSKQVSVEAEVGSVGGMEDDLVGDIIYADPGNCQQLVEETGVDVLAAALGSVHGPYKGEPKLHFDRMREIANLVDIPLSLHGGSGLSDEIIHKCIAFGHAKINVNTECSQAWSNTMRRILMDDIELYNPRQIIQPAMAAVRQVVEEKIHLFNRGCPSA